MPRFAYVNGRYVRHADAVVHIEDRGYQFADGVYEVIHIRDGRMIALPLREAREVFEREYLNAQMLRFSGNISRTAAFIGMERSALHRKLKSLGVASRAGEEAEDA